MRFHSHALTCNCFKCDSRGHGNQNLPEMPDELKEKMQEICNSFLKSLDDAGLLTDPYREHVFFALDHHAHTYKLKGYFGGLKIIVGVKGEIPSVHFEYYGGK